MGAFTTIHGHQGVQEFWDSALSTLSDPIDPGFAREFQTSTLAHDIPPERLDTLVNESLKVPARIWRATFRGFLDTPDFSHELKVVTAPTLIAWGDQDTYTPRKDQERLRAAIPGARLIVYEGAGHGFHWENPAAFAADLAAFVLECQSY